MKKLLFLFLAIVFSTFLYSFVSNLKPIEGINNNYHKRISAFEKSFLKLKPLVLALDTTHDKFDQLRIEFVNARLDYKKIEYLLEHQSPQLVKDAFNGPPFLKLARNVAGVEIQEPTSLQYLEQAIFDDISLENIAKIKQRFFKIEENLQSLSFIKKQPLTDRIFYEALRSGIIRVFSLGFSGFDVPCSGNQLGECKASWEAMKNDWNDYINKSSFKKEGKSISNLFAKGLASLEKAQDFDQFDRLSFLREIANPLFEELLVFHLKTGIETLDEVAQIPTSINYLTKSFLSEKYYNQFYASSLRKDDPLMKEKIELGKILFFDPVLSSNNQRSCASCHNPRKAFTDGKAKSIAFDFKGTVDRNSPTVINAAISTRQFWDMRANILEMQSEHVITSAKEFNHDYVSLFEKLKQSKEYVEIFQNAFPKSGSNAINKDNFSQALAAYVGSLTSFNSPFDKYVRKETRALSNEIKNGFNLFMGKAACGTCHFAPVFSGLVPPYFNDNESEVLGTLAKFDSLNPQLDPDLGRAYGQMKERSPIYNFSFKTPTIRNVALTAPYMHNGAFNTLQEVMWFYNKGGGKGLGLDVPNQTLPDEPLGLNKNEINDIIAFMKSLTDTTDLTSIPKSLPKFENQPQLNARKIGGEY